MIVISYALSSTIGGSLYDLGGWRAFATYNAVVQLCQLGILLAEPSVRAAICGCCLRKHLPPAVPRDLPGEADPKVNAETTRPRAGTDESSQSWMARVPRRPRAGTAESSQSASSHYSHRSAISNHGFACKAEHTAMRPSILSAGGAIARMEEAPTEEQAERAPPFPKDLWWPGVLVGFFSFSLFFSYQAEWSTFSVFFKDEHGWDQALWSGLAQTSGDVLAAIVMRIQARFSGINWGAQENFEAGGLRWFRACLLGKPYVISVTCLMFASTCFGMTADSLAVSVASQVLMGTVFVVGYQQCSEMSTEYSLGEPTVYAKLQAMSRAGGDLGSALGSFLSVFLYEEVGPTASFIVSGFCFLTCFLVYTSGFMFRVGCGASLELKERKRNEKRGIVRQSSWGKDLGMKGKSTDSLANALEGKDHQRPLEAKSIAEADNEKMADEFDMVQIEMNEDRDPGHKPNRSTKVSL